jgi:hypothetical protein
VCCKTKKVHELCANDASSYLGTIGCVPDEPWTIKLQVRDLFVYFKIDTGADLTVIPDFFIII